MNYNSWRNKKKNTETQTSQETPEVNSYASWRIAKSGSYKSNTTIGAKKAATISTDRADELDKLNVESTSRRIQKYITERADELDKSNESSISRMDKEIRDLEGKKTAARHEVWGSSFTDDDQKRLDELKKTLAIRTGTATAAQLRTAEEQAEYEKQIANMSALERLGEWGKNLVSGATKQYAAGTLDTNATLYEAGKNFRSAYNNTAIDDAKRNYETAVRDLDIMKSHKDEYTDKEISDQERMVETTKAQYESFSYGLSDKIQNKAIAAARDFDARIAQSGAEDVQRAVDVSYLGEFGKVATEGAASAIQSAMDGALSVGLATPGIEAGRTMIPFAVRCFGNSAMVARNSGKDIAAQVGYGIASSAIEIATEKMGNVGLQKMAYGKGFSGYEDRIASNINKAVQSLADKGLSVRGQEAVKLGLVGLSGMYTEGLEEFVGDALEIPLTLVSGVGKLPYNTEEWMNEATRDFAVGALSALVGYPASIAKSIVSNKQYASIGKDLRAKGFSVRSEIEKASVIDNDFAKEVHETAWRQYKSSGDVTDTVLGQLYSVNQQELARLYTQAQLLDRGMTLLETENGQVTPTSFKNEVNVQSTVTANTDIQEVLNKAKTEMRSGQVSTATQAQMRSTMAKHSEELTALGLDNMAAYYDTNSVIEQRKTDAVNAVVGTQTLDSIATAYLTTKGKNLPKDVAQSKAEVVQKLLNGEAVTQIEVNKLLLNSPAFVQTFNDVTGTNLTAKNNYTVKEVTDSVNEVLQKKEEVASVLRGLIENSRYAGLEEPTIRVNGTDMTYDEFRKFIKEEVPDGEDLTEEEILKEFNDTIAIQRGENNGEQLLSTEQGRADGEPEGEPASEMGRDGERPPESEAEKRGNEEAGSEGNAGGSNQSVSLDALRTTEWRPNPKLKATQVFLEEDYDKIPGAMELKALVEESGAMLIVTKDSIDTGAVDENGNTIYADAANHTAMNIIAVQAGTDIPLLVRGKHELFHRLLGTNTRSKGAFNKFARLMKQSNVLQVVRDAYDNTSGAYTNVLGDFGKNDMLYLEEFACDLYANYNRDGSIDTEVFSLLRDTVLPDFMNHKTTNPDNVRDTIDKLVVARYGVGEEDDFQYSIDSMTEAAGLTFEKDGHRTVLKNRNGDTVNEVTAEMIDKSPLGAIIKEGKKRNKDIDVGEQEQFFADLYNLMIRTNDIDLIWAVSSSVGFQPIESGARDPNTLNTNKSKFAALTKNSDKQYNKTIDFTTICVKTQAIIDAMSATMLKLGHGLTDKEIVDIVYKNTHDAGEPVPCPVCYVFSRWVGLGGLFDKMKNLQIRYENADLSELKEALSVLDKQATAIAKAKGVKGGEAREALYKEMQERFTELQSKQNLATISGKNQLTAEEQTEYDDLKRDLDILDNWTWVKTVRLSKNYKPVPDDILFDINAGKRFAEEYPESWKFRTTRGPAMGKAATPYADERIGQIIRGIAIADLKDLGDMSKNEVLKSENGELNAKAKTQLSNAIKKARVQNLLGGQRWQSTSDFRFVYALDYLLSFVELQAVGSYSQLYTKVAESVPMFASVNADTNCSLMPKGIGYHMENGVPTLGLDDFSNVTGMDIRDALNMLKEYDCVQDIIVGTSDTHIRLCMRSDFILDIIPFHASGSAEARYRSMMQTIEESVESRDDYSAYQTDHKMADRTEQQKKAYDLRIKLLTGKLGTLSDSDKQILKGNEILHNLYMRFYGLDADGNTANIDMKYLNADDRAANRTDHDSDCYGAFLTKDQAEMVMPFEYWDHTSTIKTAPEQGRAFREYCESLGLHPRFTGWTDKSYNAEKDFSDENGYWKTLIDRRMYDRDGNYREQKAIDVSKFNADYLFREPSVEGIYKPSIVNDPTKTEQIAEKSARMVAEGRGESYEQNAGMQFSVRKEAPPKNTVKAYKLMRLDEAGNLHPLFIDSQQIVKVGTWYNADSPDLSWIKNLPVGDHLVNLSTGESVPYEQYANEHNISKRVKPNNADVKWAEENGYRFMHIEDKADSKQAEAFAAKYGDSRAYYSWGINGSSKTSDGQGTASLYALRPGWHFGEVPSMGQIGYGEKGNEFRLDNQVWVEVEMAADVNYQQEAESNASKDIPSHIPTDGYYTYATNPVQKKSKTGTSENDAQKADWYVAGAFKINRILSDSEADTIVQQNNAEKGKNIPLDYRRLNGRVFNAKTMQLEDTKRSSVVSKTEYAPTFKIPEAMKQSVLYEGQPKFSIVSKSGEEVTRGLLIDDKGFAYSQKIKSLEKKGETRESRDAFLDNVAKTGERIALTRSGVGDFKAYATTKIGEPEFISAKDWEARRTDTQVPKNSTYDLKPDADGKWYYPFVDLEVLDEEVAPTSHSPRYARFDAKDLTGNTEVDKWVSNTKYSVQARTATFFSGAGTVDYALRNLIDSQIAVEYDAKIAAVYKMNNGEDIFIGDVRDVDVTQFPEGQIEYFHASPVCKNYSMAKIADEADNQIDITTAEATANALKQFKPKVFTVENVARYRNSKAMKIITDALDELGYSYDKNVYRATDFGGATIRERMFLRAVAPGGVLPEIQKTEGTNWYDAVYDLIPGLKEEAMPDWMAARLPAMGIKSVKDITEPLLIIGGNKGGKLSMAWYNQPSPTILANTHDARIVMPGGKVLRVSPRVLARIQGLPDSFKLPDKTTLAFKVIGNGVPVQLTQGIVSPLLEANIADKDIKFSISPDARKALDSALGKYGAQEQSSRDARDVKFPKQMTDNTKTMRTERTVANAAATPVGRIDTIQQAVVDQKFEYTTVTNKEAYQRAEAELKTLGWRQTVENWTKAVRGGKASVSLVATGAALLNHAGNSNASGEEYLDILIDYSTLLHNASQATQAAQILQKLTPDGRLYSVMKTVNRLNNSMREKADAEAKKAKSKGEYDPSKVSYREIKISDDLIERFRAAQTDEERDAIIDEMAQYVADQVKANKADLVNAIRYLNMLGNFKTQIRNVMGNVAFQPVRLMKDAAQGILESMMGVERTTGAKRDLATYKAGLEVYYQYRLAVMSGGKYNDNAGVSFDSLVADKRAIFTQTKNEFFNNTAGKVFEKYRNLTNTAMEKGDDVFCAFTFADSLARFMASRNTTWENASEELRTIAVNMATKEAAEATYRDNNALSNWIASLARDQKTPEFIRVVAEGILPFRKTPTNILVRAYEYSPISIIPNTIRTIRYNTGKNELSGTDIADMWAKSFSGTVLVAIGFALSAMGKLIGKAPDDDKEKALFDQKGLQAYSLVAFGRTFTLDWAAPSCIPLFIGANLFQSAMEDGLTMQEFMEAFTTRLADPIMEMSILQGVNDAIENVATYGSDQALVSFIMNAAWSYLTQLTSNTLLGQAERAYQNVRMQTYVDKNGWLPVTVQRGVGKTSAKIPGWDYNQIPYIDAWGEVEGNARNEFANIMQQLFAPWYVSQVDTSNMMAEIDRLYSATNDSGVILETADKYFTVAGQRKDLTAAEYMTYAMARGQVAKSAVNDLLKSASYKSLSDAEKVAAIKRVYDYANQKAKASVTNQYTPDKWVTEGMQTLNNVGVSTATYSMLYSATKDMGSYKDSNGESVDNSKSLKIMQQIYSTPGLSDEQIQALAEELGVNKTVRKYSSKIVDRKLEAMEKKYGN